MTRTVLLFLSLVTLSACEEYQGLSANCFNSDYFASVTRSANSLTFLSQNGGGSSTSTALVDACNFTPVGEPVGQ